MNTIIRKTLIYVLLSLIILTAVVLQFLFDRQVIRALKQQNEVLQIHTAFILQEFPDQAKHFDEWLAEQRQKVK